VRTTGPHVVEPSNRAGIYSEPRLGHVHLCGGLRFLTGPVACRRRFANRFESQHARNDAEAGGGRYRAGAAAGLKCQHAGRLGPRQTRDPLACTGGQQQVWRDVEHRQQSVVPGCAGWPPDRLLGGEGRCGPGITYRAAERHGAADYFRHRRKAIHRTDGRLGGHAESWGDQSVSDYFTVEAQVVGIWSRRPGASQRRASARPVVARSTPGRSTPIATPALLTASRYQLHWIPAGTYPR
jgi:hypothetical protein